MSEESQKERRLALEALARDHNSTAALGRLAAASEALGDFTAAATCFEMASRLNNSNSTYRTGATRTREQQKNKHRSANTAAPLSSFHIYEKVCCSSSTAPQKEHEAEFSSAGSFFSQKRYKDAIAQYTLIGADPTVTTADKARALNNISACFASMQMFQEARDVALEALAIGAPNAKTFGRVATACEGLRDYVAAENYFRVASLLDAANTAYSTGIVRTHEMQRKSAPAATAAAASSAGKVSKDAFYYSKSLEKGKEAMQKGDFVEAVRQFGKAFDLFPSGGTARERAILLANRSAAYFRLGRYAESADDALTATQSDEGYGRAFFRLGCAKHRLKKIEDAHDALARCLELEPTHADATALMAEVQPLYQEERRSAAEKRAEEARVVAELREKQLEAQAQAAAKVPAAAGMHNVHASNYVYCNYCNEHGHTRSECPLRAHKRSRFP